MYNLLNIYDCSKCGKILSDEVIHGQEIDFDNDEIYDLIKCKHCGSTANIRTSKGENGEIIYHYEEVDEERARWANGFYDDMLEQNNF